MMAVGMLTTMDGRTAVSLFLYLSVLAALGGAWLLLLALASTDQPR